MKFSLFVILNCKGIEIETSKQIQFRLKARKLPNLRLIDQAVFPWPYLNTKNVNYKNEQSAILRHKANNFAINSLSSFICLLMVISLASAQSSNPLKKLYRESVAVRFLREKTNWYDTSQVTVAIKLFRMWISF